MNYDFVLVKIHSVNQKLLVATHLLYLFLPANPILVVFSQHAIESLRSDAGVVDDGALSCDRSKVGHASDVTLIVYNKVM